jgi:hypothetical protein
VSKTLIWRGIGFERSRPTLQIASFSPSSHLILVRETELDPYKPATNHPCNFSSLSFARPLNSSFWPLSRKPISQGDLNPRQPPPLGFKVCHTIPLKMTLKVNTHFHFPFFEAGTLHSQLRSAQQFSHILYYIILYSISPLFKKFQKESPRWKSYRTSSPTSPSTPSSTLLPNLHLTPPSAHNTLWTPHPHPS